MGIIKRNGSDAIGRARQCDGKQPYDRAAAEQAVHTLRQRERDKERRKLIEAYECRWCGEWHVGHKRPS